MVQWLKIHCATQGTQVPSLVGGAKIPHAPLPKNNQNIKQNNIVANSIKTFF